MRTESQIEASRTNGAKSHGPVSDEGKAATSRNAVRHGLLCETVVVEGESADRFHEQIEAFVHEFNPQTENEMVLVEKLATARWQQLSAWGLKTAGLSQEIRDQIACNPDLLDKEPAARAFIAMQEIHANLALLQRYDVALDRTYYRALNALKATQKERITKQTQEIFA